MDYLEEMETSVTLLSETWLTDSNELAADLEELENSTGFNMLMKNRPMNTRGYSTGGVAIVYRSNKIKFKELTLPSLKLFVE